MGNVIEDFLWSTVFSTDVVSFCKVFIILILGFRLMCYLLGNKVSNAFVYIPKVLAYGILVVLLWVYFSSGENNLNSINIFTGFTFIFCVVETVDNFAAFLLELFGKGIVGKKINQKFKQDEEKHFFHILFLLRELKFALKPGKLSSKCKKNVELLWDEYKQSLFYYAQVEVFLETDNEYSLSESLCDLLFDERIEKIHEKIDREQKGHTMERITLSSEDCKRIEQLIENVLKLERQYKNNKAKTLKEKLKMDIIS